MIDAGPFLKILMEHMKYLCEHELYEWHNNAASHILQDEDKNWYVTNITKNILIKVANVNCIPDAFADHGEVRLANINGLKGDYIPLDYAGTAERVDGKLDIYLTEDDRKVFLSTKLLGRYFTKGEQGDMVLYYKSEAKKPEHSFIAIGDSDGNLIGYVLPVKIKE